MVRFDPVISLLLALKHRPLLEMARRIGLNLWPVIRRAHWKHHNMPLLSSDAKLLILFGVLDQVDGLIIEHQRIVLKEHLEVSELDGFHKIKFVRCRVELLYRSLRSVNCPSS